MRLVHSQALLFSVLVCSPFFFSQDATPNEKVSEGQYLQWQDGHPVKDTSQAWTIWRTSDGFTIEDKLPVDKGILLMAAMGAELNANMSPELRSDMKNLVMPTEISLQLTKEKAIRSLLLSGKKTSDLKELIVADCQVAQDQISCKGQDASTHLKHIAQDQFLYPSTFPLLFTQLLKQPRPPAGQTVPVTLVLLDHVNNKHELSRVSGQLRGEGMETMVLGQNSFPTERYVLSLEAKNGSRQIKLWTLGQGIVLAMEDSRFSPGTRIVLTEYKRFADF